MNINPNFFLLIEDDNDHAELVMRIFDKVQSTIKIDRVSDGEQAMRYLNQHHEFANRPKPDIILLDLNLPKIDGFEVLKFTKSHDVLKKIPVVILTTSDADADREHAYLLGANSYVTKPLEFKQFQQMLADLLNYWNVWNLPPPR